MAKNALDSKLIEYKDTISQLNTTIRTQEELISSFQQTIDNCNNTIALLNEKVNYLTKKRLKIHDNISIAVFVVM